jgi:glycosyltransferase involved in cell wall biosynthesis
MRLAYLSASSGLGGAERCLVDLLAVVGQLEPFWRLHLIVPSEGLLAGAARTHGVDVTVLPLPALLARFGDARVRIGWPLARHLTIAALRAVPYARILARCLEDIRPDLVHSNTIKTHVLSVAAAPRGVPVLWHLHDYIGARPVSRVLLRLLSRRCAAAIANSPAVAADAQRVFGGGTVVRCVPNGIDLDEFSPPGGSIDLDAVSGLRPAGPEVVRIGLIATMAFWKGHDVFLRALRSLSKHATFRAYLIGGPMYDTAGSQVSLDDVRRTIAELGLDHQVGLTGFLERPAAAMRALDIVVHASTRPEPFGLVVAEAMACGRAVIASRESGVADFVRDGEDVILCESNVADLTRALRTVVSDGDLRSRLGVHARATALKCFDRARMGGEAIAVYRDVARASG